MSGHPYEYRRCKNYMMGLLKKGYCSQVKIHKMETLNVILELKLEEGN